MYLKNVGKTPFNNRGNPCLKKGEKSILKGEKASELN